MTGRMMTDEQRQRLDNLWSSTLLDVEGPEAHDDLMALMADRDAARAEAEWHKGRYDRTVALHDEMATRVATLAQELDAARAELAEDDGVIAVWRRRTEQAEAEVAALKVDRDEWMASSAGYGSDMVEWKGRAQWAEAEVARLRDVLVELEWHDNDCCPWCGRSQPDGHDACDLADALALAAKEGA